MNETLDLYIDRHGKQHVPSEDDVIMKRSGAYALFRYNDHILLHWPTYSPGLMDLIGGGVDEGEDPIENTLWRETEEETGFKISPLPIVKQHTHFLGFKATDLNKFTNHHFHTYLFDVTPEIIPFFTEQRITPENGQMEWIKIENIKDTAISKIHLPSIQALLFDKA